LRLSAAPACVLVAQPHHAKLATDATEARRADRHVENHVGREVGIAQQVVAQFRERLIVGKIAAEKEQPLAETVQHGRIGGSVCQVTAHLFAPGLVAPVATAEADHLETVR